MPSPARPYRSVPPLHRAVNLLSRLNDSQFATFLQEVRGPRAFDTEAARIDALTSALKFDQANDTIILLASCGFLYDRAHESAGDNRDITDITRDLLQFSGLWPRSDEQASALLQRLSAVLRSNPIRDQELKRHWLQTGILDLATAFSSFVDLRPNFAQDRQDITELLPVVIFNIDVQTESGDDRSYAFQLSETSLSQLARAVADVQLKLSRLRAHSVLANMIPKTDEEENV
jgi:hypothetical protein